MDSQDTYLSSKTPKLKDDLEWVDITGVFIEATKGNHQPDNISPLTTILQPFSIRVIPFSVMHIYLHPQI